MTTKHYSNIDWSKDFRWDEPVASQYGTNVKIYGPGISLSTYAEGGVVIPFEPSSYSKNPDDTRLDIVMNIESISLQQKLSEFNDYLLNMVCQRKNVFFPNEDDLQDRDIKRGFKRPYVTNNINNTTGKAYAPMLKGKLYTDGDKAVRVFQVVNTNEMEPVSLAAITRRSVALVHLTVDQIWIRPGLQWGVTINIMTVCILRSAVKRDPMDVFDFGTNEMKLVPSKSTNTDKSVLLNSSDDALQPTLKRAHSATPVSTNSFKRIRVS